jgi:uncharacterized protein
VTRGLAALAATLLALALPGCGSVDEAERVAEEARERAERLRDRAEDEVRGRAERVILRAEELNERVRRRVEEVLAEIERAVPEAGPGTERPTTAGRHEPGSIGAFLTDVIENVDAYWTETLAASGLPEPRVGYNWVAPGRRAWSRCGVAADDRAAFYCPADDTIYVGQRLASEVYDGVARGFPGQERGYGQAVGDFGVAYIVAHEYAHNLQQELGFFRANGRTAARPFELQADCMAGLWGNSVFEAGELQPGDVEEALSTALAVGDFDYGNEQHHGTPQERREAWLTGFESGDPSDCTRFTQV